MTTQPKPIKVALMVDDPLALQGIKSQLAGRDDLCLVAEMDTAENLYPLLASTKPHVLLFGAHVPQTKRDSLMPLRLVKALQQVGRQHPQVAVILLARHYLPLAKEALRWVQGYILHGGKAALRLAAAVRHVHSGNCFYSQTVRRELFCPQKRRRQDKQLDKVQIAILALIASDPQGEASRHAEALGMNSPPFSTILPKFAASSTPPTLLKATIANFAKSPRTKPSSLPLLRCVSSSFSLIRTLPANGLNPCSIGPRFAISWLFALRVDGLLNGSQQPPRQSRRDLGAVKGRCASALDSPCASRLHDLLAAVGKMLLRPTLHLHTFLDTTFGSDAKPLGSAAMPLGSDAKRLGSAAK